MATDGSEADLDEAGGRSQLRGMKMAFTDPKVSTLCARFSILLTELIQTYILAIMYHCIVGATGFQNFFPSLTETLYPNNTIVALLVVAPPYIFMMLYSYAHSYTSDKLRNRFWFWVYPIPIVLVGCFVFMFTDDFGPRYFSLFLLNFAFAMNSTVSSQDS